MIQTQFKPVAKAQESTFTRDVDLEVGELEDVDFRRLFEASQDGILVLDATTRKIAAANPFLCLLLGVTQRDLIGKNPASLATLAPLFKSSEWPDTLSRDGIYQRDHVTLRSRSGQKIFVEVVFNVYHSGSRKMVLCNVRDTTQRQVQENVVRQLNESLEQRVDTRTTELESAIRELEAFTYSVSHDLRAPLRHIMGFVEILENEASTILPEIHRHHLGTISNAARRMAELIDDLLAFSRIGRSEMQKSRVNLGELVREAINDLHEETKERFITWNISVLPDVNVDRSLMRQALVNLISNAVKFTSTRHHAQITIGHEKSEAEQNVFFIRDNGVGFDPRYASKLFGVFERLHNGRDFEGTGIGLANVQRIIRRHGGDIRSSSRLDEGATFYFSIPLASKL